MDLWQETGQEPPPKSPQSPLEKKYGRFLCCVHGTVEEFAKKKGLDSLKPALERISRLSTTPKGIATLIGDLGRLPGIPRRYFGLDVEPGPKGFEESLFLSISQGGLNVGRIARNTMGVTSRYIVKRYSKPYSSVCSCWTRRYAGAGRERSWRPVLGYRKARWRTLFHESGRSQPIRRKALPPRPHFLGGSRKKLAAHFSTSVSYFSHVNYTAYRNN